MPVALILNREQMEVFNAALKGSKLEITTKGRQVTLTRDNHENIREAVEKLRDKKLAIKTKTVVHLEMCYLADQIIDRINTVAVELAPLPEVENDNTIGLVVDNTVEEEESSDNSEAEESDSGTTEDGSEG